MNQIQHIMETNNNINRNEFDEMRSQLEIMKRQLDSQKIINDRIIRQAMKQKMSWIKRYIWFELLVLYPIIIISFVGFTVLFNLSWIICMLIIGLTGLDIYADFKINKVSDTDWHNDNLVKTAMKLAHMKRMRMLQLIISIPALIVVFGMFFLDMSSCHEYILKGAIIGGITGGCIGLAIGIWILMKMQRTNDEIIEQINEITKEKD